MMFGMNRFFQLVRKLRPMSLSALAHDDSVVAAARGLVRYYYYLAPFTVFMYAASPLAARQNFDPVWSLFWSNALSLEYVTTLNIIRFGALAAVLIGIFAHRYMVGRIAVCVAFLHIHALESSFGSQNHQLFLWVYTSFLLIFLPAGWERDESFESRHKLLLSIWLAQAVVMLSYTMAGLQKFHAGIVQSMQGSVGALSPEAFAYHIAYWLPRLQEEAAFGPFIIEHPFVGWPFFVGIVFVQIFALWTMVRPGLQKNWIFILVIFHFGTYFTMGISFHPMILLIIVLFLGTPFAKREYSLREFMYDLPILGQVLEYLASARKYPKQE